MNLVVSGFGNGCIIEKNDILSFRPPKLGDRYITMRPIIGRRKISNTVSSYEIIDKVEKVPISQKVTRGVIGASLLGTAGAVIGASTVRTNVLYKILINWTDNKQSVIEIDEDYFNVFIRSMY